MLMLHLLKKIIWNVGKHQRQNSRSKWTLLLHMNNLTTVNGMQKERINLSNFGKQFLTIYYKAKTQKNHTQIIFCG